MSNVLMHKYSAQRFEVKSTDCHHHLVRQVYNDCSGEQRTSWKRVPVNAIEQLIEDCIEVQNV